MLNRNRRGVGLGIEAECETINAAVLIIRVNMRLDRDDRSIAITTMMMGWHDFSDWIAWGLLICAFLVVLAVAITYLQRFCCCCFGRRKAPPLFIEELLESIPDVAYQELPDAAAAGDDDRDSCVICIMPYEALL